MAAGSYAGVPITHRELASAVAFVAGQEGDDKEGPPFDYRRLAQFPGTLVIYMGVTTAPHWTAKLLEAGMPADTPALIVRKCSLPGPANGPLHARRTHAASGSGHADAAARWL